VTDGGRVLGVTGITRLLMKRSPLPTPRAVFSLRGCITGEISVIVSNKLLVF